MPHRPLPPPGARSLLLAGVGLRLLGAVLASALLWGALWLELA